MADVTPRARLLAVREELRGLFVEREELVDGALAALIARAHVLIVGPPGSAKSMLAGEICRRIEGGAYFEWLLTKFTTPEELFGAISLRALEEDRYVRVVDGKLPRAHIAFLDEVFKASSAILNTLLSVCNERVFHNGGVPTPVPLYSLFGATNELPDEDDLAALYDRFLLRYVVRYVEEDYRFLKMVSAPPPTAERTRLQLGELDQLAAEAETIVVPEPLLRDLVELRRTLQKRNIVASDRRWRQAIPLLRAHALLGGRSRVSEVDLRLLEHVLWTQPEDHAEIVTVLGQLLRGHEEQARKLLYQGREVAELARRPWDDDEQAERALIEAHTKLKALLGQLAELERACASRERDLEPIETARAELERLQSEMFAGQGPPQSEDRQ